MKISQLLSMIASLCLASCAGDARRATTTAGFTAAGAGIGHSLDDGAAGPVIGAAAGYVGGELLATFDKKEDKAIFKTGSLPQRNFANRIWPLFSHVRSGVPFQIEFLVNFASQKYRPSAGACLPFAGVMIEMM